MKDNKTITNAWAFYDWANSVFPLVITSTIFPVYYETVTTSDGSDIVNFLGINIKNTALFSYAISFSFLIVAFISPLLSGIADYTGYKKRFMQFFVIVGSVSCSSLYFFDGSNLIFGIVAFMLGGIGFAGSLVFYNAYLPEISSHKNMDKLSAKGFAMGYIGSVLLLIFNLVFILNASKIGINDPLFPSKIAFLSVGIWWFSFSQYTFHYLPDTVVKSDKEGLYLKKGYEELVKVWKELKTQRTLKIYLLSFFFFNMGVQTVIYMAALFGKKEVGVAGDNLIVAILLLQTVAILGSFLFSGLSKIKGNVFTLKSSLIIWILITFSAYLVRIDLHFFILAFFVGLVMGGIQSISRSTYSKLIPKYAGSPTTSYFSFYELTEKISIVLGTASYGLIEDISGSMRNSVFALAAFFIIGYIILNFINKDEKLQGIR